jgi:hypothetical protein
MTTQQDRRWWALIVLCMGNLMIVLDTTIVNVALPSIRTDLGFTEASLAWVVNAYLLTFGGCLLLGGRLGDIYGHRKLFLTGLVLFTASSVACGLSTGQSELIAARAVQGVGGAIVAAVALSLVMTLFVEPGERARAMGVVGFVAAGGGSIGVLLGGVLTDALDWHWIFLVNLPVGIAVFVACLKLVPVDRLGERTARLDVAGAVTVTTALMVAVYAIVNGNRVGWVTAQTLGMLFWTAGFLLFARVPVNGDYLTDVLPAMLVLGVGAGIGFNPVLLAAMNDVEPSEAGLASGVVNTSFMMGGARGLAVLASAAASRTSTLVSQGESEAAALTGGYHVAFLIGAAFTLIAAGLAVLVLRPITMGAPAEVHDVGSHSRQPAPVEG